MKVLIFGPSGSGKTYVVHALKQQGINAFDDPDIPGLSNWYNTNGKKVSPPPATADEALNNHYSFLWSVKAMQAFLNQFNEVYVFGGSGNVAGVFHLFDKVYFLHVNPELQKERILSTARPTPMMDKNDDGVVIWGGWFEELAKDRNIPFIDASQTPEEIYKLIKST
jgi:hypothetical protein